MSNLVDVVTERVGARRVTRVRLEIGELAGVASDALHFCFEACALDTPLAGAALEVVSIAGRARCNRCGVVDAMPSLATPCACGSFDRQVVAGHELRLKDVELEVS